MLTAMSHPTCSRTPYTNLCFLRFNLTLFAHPYIEWVPIKERYMLASKPIPPWVDIRRPADRLGSFFFYSCIGLTYEEFLYSFFLGD